MASCGMAPKSAPALAGGSGLARQTGGKPRAVAARAASRKLWAPGVEAPAYLDDSLAGDYGWDPLALGADPVALKWYRQAELQHARWAMLGCAGILGQELVNPDVFWYEAALPQNLPEPFTNVNMGGLLAFEFLMMHYVEVRRWQDYRNPGSVNEDPIFKGNSVPNEEMGYPGGLWFDPFGYAKGDKKSLQTKEIKNGRLAMVAWTGFAIQAQATGKGPIACLTDHLSAPFDNTIIQNIGSCVTPDTVDVQGVTIPLICLWPGAQ
eukprot:evm.model.scf_1870.2 EVM.evm.TU.scf_1870.2   scf_1870:22374-24665(-)